MRASGRRALLLKDTKHGRSLAKDLKGAISCRFVLMLSVGVTSPRLCFVVFLLREKQLAARKKCLPGLRFSEYPRRLALNSLPQGFSTLETRNRVPFFVLVSLSCQRICCVSAAALPDRRNLLLAQVVALLPQDLRHPGVRLLLHDGGADGNVPAEDQGCRGALQQPRPRLTG